MMNNYEKCWSEEKKNVVKVIVCACVFVCKGYNIMTILYILYIVLYFRF